jgi:predicted type IV restriction endonuclease
MNQPCVTTKDAHRREELARPLTYRDFYMQLRSNVSLSDGHRALQALIKELDCQTIDWNEATTRLHIIDRILVECLGWPKTSDKFRVEVHADGQFQDYVLGSPESVVWEAKRFGAYFDFPADAGGKPTQSIKEIFGVSKTAERAMRQVQGYCNYSGIEVAAVCNGHQIIAFVAVRVGHSWLKGQALTIRNFQQLNEEFSLVWQCLSPDGIFEKRLLSLLTTGSTRSIPRKLLTQLLRFPAFRYKTELQVNLRALSELLPQDVVSHNA